MSVKPYTETEEGAGVAKAGEPVIMPSMEKRVATKEELAGCKTLNELHQHLTKLIHDHYHPAQ